jgi:hypothetical protein
MVGFITKMEMSCQMNAVWTELYTGDPDSRGVEKDIKVVWL